MNNNNNILTLLCNNMTMLIDPMGGRIISFKLKNTEMLGGGKEKMLQGSTFWISPQSSWCKERNKCWPPSRF